MKVGIGVARSLTRYSAYGVLSTWTLIVGVPILWMAMSSLKSRQEIFSDPFGLPSSPQWSNFKAAWDQGIAGFLVNSIIITGLSVLVIVAVSTLATYALAKQRFVGRTFVYGALIASYAIPLHSVLVPLHRLLAGSGLLNTRVGLIGPYVAFAIPFSILLMYGFFVDFPQDLEDAARLDGANTIQVLRDIVIPVLRPGLITVAIFQAVFIWNEFLLALIVVTDEQLKTLPLGLVSFQAQYASNISLILGALTISTIPLLLLYVVLQRHFINSLAGFAKG